MCWELILDRQDMVKKMAENLKWQSQVSFVNGVHMHGLLKLQNWHVRTIFELRNIYSLPIFPRDVYWLCSLSKSPQCRIPTISGGIEWIVGMKTTFPSSFREKGWGHTSQIISTTRRSDENLSIYVPWDWGPLKRKPQSWQIQRGKQLTLFECTKSPVSLYINTLCTRLSYL